MPITLQQLATQLNLKFKGDANLEITGVASLEKARAGELCFLAQNKYLKDIPHSQCSVLIVPTSTDLSLIDRAVILSTNPQYSFSQAIALICPEKLNSDNAGIHTSVQLADSAIIGDEVSIGALSVIGEHVVIGRGTCIGAGCIIEDNVQIGTDCLLHSRVTLAHEVKIGDRCQFQTGAVIGSDGFGLVEQDRRWIKVPQLGTVEIGNDVEIGANTAVDRGALDNTVIEDGCKLDNLIQVAHNVHIGAHTAIAGCVGIAGSAVIGKHCKIGGAASILGHLSVADNVMITATSLVSKDIRQSGVYSSGTPLMENSQWRKSNVRYKSLDKLARTVSRLDKKS